MQFAEPDFRPIKPYGNIGDRKNDGYVPSKGRYFQVYAPDQPTFSATKAAKKASEDLDGLFESWNENTPIKEYYFVFNDEYLGSPPPLEDTLANIRTKNKIYARAFLAKDLENLTFDLDDDQILSVLDTIVPESGTFDTVPYDMLGEVVRHILEFRTPIGVSTLTEAPEFDKKIEFNGLTSPVASLLKYGAFQNDAVTDFFSKNSRHCRQQLRDELANAYEEIRDIRSDTPVEDRGDIVFLELLERVIPRGVTFTTQQNADAQQAAIVLLAYYFEACDIFEYPDAAS